MKLFTREIEAQLRANLGSEDEDRRPVCKLFDPCGGATWLLLDLSDDGACFGLCDLGQGYPELGYVGREELESYRGPLGLGLERDLYWTASKSLSEYADEAREFGRIRT
jgi:hypothetical protein